jgi:hypothetical protein
VVIRRERALHCGDEGGRVREGRRHKRQAARGASPRPSAWLK